MKRETTNKIRFFLEEILPPILRDSFIFKFIVEKFYRNDVTHINLKNNIIKISKEEYNNYYKLMPDMHENSDLSEKCIEEIIKNITGNSVIDVGCGKGYLINKIHKKIKNIKISGAEIVISEKLNKIASESHANIFNFSVEEIFNINQKFDTVICTHVLEHILDIRTAYENLLKITNKKLIIVIPRERPNQFSFNGHLHFFPYEWSFVNTIIPKNNFKIKEIQRDFFYCETII